jgi:hypothetical protein
MENEKKKFDLCEHITKYLFELKFATKKKKENSKNDELLKKKI